jgi:hypothetical protein
MPLKHLVRLLTLLALLLAPAGMMGNHMAMAAPQPAGGHCADANPGGHEAPRGEAPAQGIDCLIACSCVPAFAAELADPPSFAATPASSSPVALGSGLNPQADPPPPRIS